MWYYSLWGKLTALPRIPKLDMRGYFEAEKKGEGRKEGGKKRKVRDRGREKNISAEINIWLRPCMVVDSRLSAVVIGFLLSGVCTVLIGYVNCMEVFAVALVVVSTAFIGISSAAVLGVNQLDLSPRYAGRTTRCALLCSVVRMKLIARWPSNPSSPVQLVSNWQLASSSQVNLLANCAKYNIN